MQVHFTFNDGDGVEHDGTYQFADIKSAKADALRYLADYLREDVREAGEIAAAVAALDQQGKPLFSMTMHVSITVSDQAATK